MNPTQGNREGQPEPADLILSSGFLAFARHVGVLRALRERDVAIDAVVGTSSGAVVGALWAAGHSIEEIVQALDERQPYTLMRPHLVPWRGLFSLGPLHAYLAARLPATFEELQRPLALGVKTASGGHQLLTSGDLCDAVLASVSMPYVFAPMRIDGQAYQDGGAVDRLGFRSWRSWRGDRPVVVHRVRKTAGTDVDDDLGSALLIETPRSGASFFSLGDFRGQVSEAEQIALTALDSQMAQNSF